MELDRKSFYEKTRKMIVSLSKSHQEKTLKVIAKNTDVKFLNKVKELINKYNINVSIKEEKNYTYFEYEIIV